MSNYKNNSGDEGFGRPDPASVAFAETAHPVPVSPAFDAAQYRTHIEPFGLSDRQERELLETLWSIMYSFMYSFVELGFATDICSVIFGTPEVIAEQQASVVNSLNATFAEASNNPAEGGPS